MQYAGEWDLPLNRAIYAAFDLYMKRRRRMSLVLRVDGDRWRAHLRGVAERHPDLVPVAKGNGYGLGMGRLARKAQWLGVDTLAVGTYDELPHVAQRFDGDLLVMTPWRPFNELARTTAPGDPHRGAARGPLVAGRARPVR